MGLLQKAVETYDAMSNLAGVSVEGKSTLAPIGHIITTAKIEITLDQDGILQNIRKFDEKIIIPVTEESAGRSGDAIASHPLCDQICYIAQINSKKNSEKRESYINNLNDWMNSDFGNPKLNAIYSYVISGSIVEDLNNASLLKRDSNGNVKNDHDIICWNVVGLGMDSGPVWTDMKLLKSYTAFYLNKIEEGQKNVCMIEGNESAISLKHPRGIISSDVGARLISSNDDDNYTYRGRFVDKSEALTVSYLASQKAHNALKWVISNSGDSHIGNRTIVCWNPAGIEVPSPQNPLFKPTEPIIKPSDYKKELQLILGGYQSSLPKNEDVVIAAFQAATPGRVSVTYYNELQASDFLDRLAYWDETCCWCHSRFGISSPSLFNIVNFAYGTQRGNDDISKVVTDERIVSEMMQRMISCRVDQMAFPLDIMKSIVSKTVMLSTYNRINRENLLFTACAVIRKYYIDRFKEVYELALEANKKDCSYQYGRLLAVYEKIENDATKDEKNHETNAMRLQAMYIRRPAVTAATISEQLKRGYYRKLSTGRIVFYERLIGEIMQEISSFDEGEQKRSLKETYLMGYYLQKNRLWEKTNTANSDIEEEE